CGIEIGEASNQAPAAAVRCPKCGTETCQKCGKKWHPNLTCEGATVKSAEELATEAMLQQQIAHGE
ncbi:MAG: hypothetical protein MHM6MM_007687, partial [Cercozoa sp. M6MM]